MLPGPRPLPARHPPLHCPLWLSQPALAHHQPLRLRPQVSVPKAAPGHPDTPPRGAGPPEPGSAPGRLKECLRQVNDTASRVVGQAFFNVIQVPCFEFTYREECVEPYLYVW